MGIRTFAAIAVLLAAAGVSAEVRIEAGWVRAMPPVAATTAGYARLHNTGASAVTVKAGSVDWAGGAALHAMDAGEDGTTRMRHLDTLRIEPGERVELAPGGRHLMFTELERVPEAGEQVPVCFLVDSERLCRNLPVRRNPPGS